jgi:hypothetical protein
MKIKKIFLLSVVCVVTFLSVTDAFAWGWYKCTVARAGVGGVRFEVQLSGTGISGTSGSVNQWFEFHPDVTDEMRRFMVASILAAMNMEIQVEVLVIPGTTQSLYALYLSP